jgi:nucleoside-diphosphate-sugar epimerase
MARVLVTGAAGVLGSRLVARLVERGHSVRGLVMPADPLAARLAHAGCEIWQGDIRNPESLRGACVGMDCVYHLAAIIISHDPQLFTDINLQGTRNVLAEADSAGVGHFIYASSASVTYPKLTAYAQSKLDAEREVAARSGGFSIVRPTLVYDEHGGQEVRMFLEYLRRFPVVPFIGAGDALKRPVWSEDIVDGLMRLAEAPGPYGKTYNLSGGEAISMRDFAKLLLRQHRAERPFVHLPVWLCRGVAHVLARVMDQPPLTLSAIAGVVNDANLDPSEAMRDLGYRPIGVREGYARCFNSPQAAVRAAADLIPQTRKSCDGHG